MCSQHRPPSHVGITRISYWFIVTDWLRDNWLCYDWGKECRCFLPQHHVQMYITRHTHVVLLVYTCKNNNGYKDIIGVYIGCVCVLRIHYRYHLSYLRNSSWNLVHCSYMLIQYGTLLVHCSYIAHSALLHCSSYRDTTGFIVLLSCSHIAPRTVLLVPCYYSAHTVLLSCSLQCSYRAHTVLLPCSYSVPTLLLRCSSYRILV